MAARIPAMPGRAGLAEYGIQNETAPGRTLTAMTAVTAIIRKLERRALCPVDGASAAAFRILFGLLGLLAVARFFAYDWIDALYIAPAHHFAYPGFGWVQPWPGWGMYAHFAALGLLSIGIAAGYRWRICAALFGIGFTYVELLDQTTYLNHYYLVSLLALLLAVLPLSGPAVPRWAIWTLRCQIGIVYVFAGIAKLNPDWLLHALPLRIWLYQHGELPLAGPLLAATGTAYIMSWAGALFDLAVVPALLWRRTRIFAYAALAAFHLLTGLLFPQLGIFPWLMIASALLFFPPDWPHRLRAQLRWRPYDAAAALTPPAPQRIRRSRSSAAIAGAVALALFVLLQITLPLRHYAYPGNVRWNEQGYRLAWRVMLSEKTGFVQYRVRHPATGQTWTAFPDAYLTPLQTERMAIQPTLILQTAHIIAADFAERGYPGVAVYADAWVAFNGRPNAQLIDPETDLAAIKPGLALAPKRWILPYDAAAGRHDYAGR